MADSMIENPHTLAAEDARRERSEREAFHYPIHVCAVYWEDTKGDHKHIGVIKDWCQQNKVTFKAREYNSTRYDEDCHYVARFPAYHVYWNKHHYKTANWDENPVRLIQDVILEWKKEEEKKEARKAKLQELKTQVRNWFRLSNFKKKPRLEVTLTPKPRVSKAAVPIELDVGRPKLSQ